MPPPPTVSPFMFLFLTPCSWALASKSWYHLTELLFGRLWWIFSPGLLTRPHKGLSNLCHSKDSAPGAHHPIPQGPLCGKAPGLSVCRKNGKNILGIALYSQCPWGHEVQRGSTLLRQQSAIRKWHCPVVVLLSHCPHEPHPYIRKPNTVFWDFQWLSTGHSTFCHVYENLMQTQSSGGGGLQMPLGLNPKGTGTGKDL